MVDRYLHITADDCCDSSDDEENPQRIKINSPKKTVTVETELDDDGALCVFLDVADEIICPIEDCPPCCDETPTTRSEGLSGITDAGLIFQDGAFLGQIDNRSDVPSSLTDGVYKNSQVTVSAGEIVGVESCPQVVVNSDCFAITPTITADQITYKIDPPPAALTGTYGGLRFECGYLVGNPGGAGNSGEFTIGEGLTRLAGGGVALEALHPDPLNACNGIIYDQFGRIVACDGGLGVAIWTGTQNATIREQGVSATHENGCVRLDLSPAPPTSDYMLLIVDSDGNPAGHTLQTKQQDHLIVCFPDPSQVYSVSVVA